VEPVQAPESRTEANRSDAIEPREATRSPILRSYSDSFCKAGTFYLVFKEHRTGSDDTNPLTGIREVRFLEPIPVRSVGHLSKVRRRFKGLDERIFGRLADANKPL
jgi:hypothetical protein